MPQNIAAVPSQSRLVSLLLRRQSVELCNLVNVWLRLTEVEWKGIHSRSSELWTNILTSFYMNRRLKQLSPLLADQSRFFIYSYLVYLLNTLVSSRFNIQYSFNISLAWVKLTHFHITIWRNIVHLEDCQQKKL